MRGERNWCDLIDFLNEIPMGARYIACLQEDEELAEWATPQQKAEPADSPSWREFDKHSYDYARIIALLEQLLIAAQRGNPAKAGIEPWVPVPAVEKVHREKRLTKLRATVARATGKEA